MVVLLCSMDLFSFRGPQSQDKDQPSGQTLKTHPLSTVRVRTAVTFRMAERSRGVNITSPHQQTPQ